MRRPVYYVTLAQGSTGDLIDLGIFSSERKAKAKAREVMERSRVFWETTTWGWICHVPGDTERDDDSYSIQRRVVQ